MKCLSQRVSRTDLISCPEGRSHPPDRRASPPPAGLAAQLLQNNRVDFAGYHALLKIFHTGPAGEGFVHIGLFGNAEQAPHFRPRR